MVASRVVVVSAVRTTVCRRSWARRASSSSMAVVSGMVVSFADGVVDGARRLPERLILVDGHAAERDEPGRGKLGVADLLAFGVLQQDDDAAVGVELRRDPRRRQLAHLRGAVDMVED